MFSIVKLDKRHSGNQLFNYRIEFNGDYRSRHENYCLIRQWCWNTFGPSLERDLYLKYSTSVFGNIMEPVWCFHYDHGFDRALVYLKGDKETTLLLLKWSQHGDKFGK